MAKDVNIVVLCNEIYDGLKAKGCGMTPVVDSEGNFNGEFVNIVFDALQAAKKWFRNLVFSKIVRMFIK